MLTRTETCAKLQDHAADMKKTSLRQLFADDPDRKSRFIIETDGLKLDYSRSLITEETIGLLTGLAEETRLRQAIQDMFSGQPINNTENRPALHIALRNVSNQPIMLDGRDVMPLVNKALEKMYSFAEKIRMHQHAGFTGKPIKNIVNIGIGGSDLGPNMAYEALKFYSQRDLKFRFISNVDPADFYEKTLDLDPVETLFIISSKTFTTDETMSNAITAKAWLQTKIPDESAIARHFAAVSTNKQAVIDFGIDENNMFKFWDWVGGRYSLMSSIGLSLAIAIGRENFEQLRKGANSIDQHFLTAKLTKNIPVILGLIGIWNRNFFGFSTEVILPYSQYLHRLPAYLQQASMESNGKSITASGEEVNYQTAPILWGEPGTNGQHSFHQLLHQGTETVPVDFIGFDKSLCDTNSQHAKLNTNLLAQAEALAFGNTKDDLASDGTDQSLIPHKLVAGNKPSNIISVDQLTPFSLGQIIALYEHRIFVQGQIWRINSFDQFGVELGKKLAKSMGKKSL